MYVARQGWDLSRWVQVWSLIVRLGRGRSLQLSPMATRQAQIDDWDRERLAIAH